LNRWISFQKPHRFYCGHDPIEQQLGVKSNCERREHKQASAAFFRGRDALLFIPIRIERYSALL
jgi:hypothetical protein